MSVDANTVRRIAHLARIAVADEEAGHLAGELNAILAFVEQLQEVDVAGVEPMTSVTPMKMTWRTPVVRTRSSAPRRRANGSSRATNGERWSSGVSAPAREAMNRYP